MCTDFNKLSEWEKIAKIWQFQLNLEYCNPHKNVRLSFKDIGAFTELMAINYAKGYVGSGSGGMGLDLINHKTKKAIEVKSCCTIQNAKCSNKKCGTKFNSLFMHKCPKCGSTEYKDMSDSRFGIDAKEFLKQNKKGIFDKFYLCHVSKVEYDETTTILTVHLEWFYISFENAKYRGKQMEYFENQASKGRKAHCNLLPNSFDFYKLVPTKISDITMQICVKDLNKTPVVKETACSKPLRIHIDKMHNSTEKELFRNLKTYDPKTCDADVIDFTMNIPYAKKSLGKKRGDTRKEVYKPIA